MGKGVDISKKTDKRQRERAIRPQISEDSRVRQACHNKWFKQQNPIVGELGLDRLELEDDERDQQQREDDEGDQHEDDQQQHDEDDDEGDQMRVTSSSMRVTSMRMRQTCLSAAQLPTTEAQPPSAARGPAPQCSSRPSSPLAQLVLAQRPTTEAQLLSVQFYIDPIL